jgi:hypothetical protein
MAGLQESDFNVDVVVTFITFRAPTDGADARPIKLGYPASRFGVWTGGSSSDPEK